MDIKLTENPIKNPMSISNSATPALSSKPEILHPKETLSVLLVEDNIINQRVLNKQLCRLGCTVYIANHGVEALDFIKTTRFWSETQGAGLDLSVILMDWEMPVMDGMTCTRNLREMEHDGLVTEHLAVIATTANVRPDQVRTAYSAGVVSFHFQSFFDLKSIKYSNRDLTD